VPISWARPATRVAIEARSSAARALLGLPQLLLLHLDLARQRAADRRELAVQVRQTLVVPLDVGVHRELGVEQQHLHERGQRLLDPLRVPATLRCDHGREQGEVQRVGAEVVARAEADLRVDRTDPDPLLEVLLVERRTGQAQQVVALLAQQPLGDGRVGEQAARLVEREQVPVERRDEAIGVALEQRSEIAEQAAVGFAQAQEREAVVEFFLHRAGQYPARTERGKAPRRPRPAGGTGPWQGG